MRLRRRNWQGCFRETALRSTRLLCGPRRKHARRLWSSEPSERPSGRYNRRAIDGDRQGTCARAKLRSVGRGEDTFLCISELVQFGVDVLIGSVRCMLVGDSLQGSAAPGAVVRTPAGRRALFRPPASSPLLHLEDPPLPDHHPAIEQWIFKIKVTSEE